MKTLKFSKVRDVKSPERGTDRSAGIDFFVPNGQDYYVSQHSDVLIPSGIKVDIPEGFMLMAADKSGVATSYMACVKAGRTPKNDAFNSAVIIGAKIIDEDYQGEIGLHLINVGNSPIVIRAGQKIAQFILVPVEYCAIEEVPEDSLFSTKTQRGEGGFGSTNKKKVSLAEQVAFEIYYGGGYIDRADLKELMKEDGIEPIDFREEVEGYLADHLRAHNSVNTIESPFYKQALDYWCD